MASFTQAISDAFSAIFQLFASIFQTIASALQSLASMLRMVIENIVTFAARFIEFLFQNIVVVLAVVGAFFIYAVYRQRQGRPVIEGKKTK